MSVKTAVAGPAEALGRTVGHFFPQFNVWLKELTDIRNQRLITYQRQTVVWAMLLLLIMRQGARRQLHEKLNLSKNAAANLAVISNQVGLQRLPHGDSVEYLSLRLAPEELEALLAKMMGSLLRGRVLEKYRLLGKYYTVAIDGVHLYTFDYPHCSKCLVKENKDGKKQWQHYVLKASLVTCDGLCLPLACEWIENMGVYDKQDCEYKAFYRLIKKIRERLPRLPICVLLDALYAAKPIFAALAQAKLEWITVFKEGSMPEVFAWVMAQKARHASENVVRRRYVKFIPERQKRSHAERLVRREAEKRTRKVIEETRYSWSSESHWREGGIYNILTCKEEYDGQVKCDYIWMVSEGLKLNEKTVEELAEKGGRCCWKIENKNFNEQKNGGYGLEHCYSRDEVSMKNWVLMIDIAQMLSQLMSRVKELRKKSYGGLRNLAQKIFEQFCYELIRIPSARPRMQIRLSG